MFFQNIVYPTLINTTTVQESDLLPLAFSGFAHFTAMQIRDSKVQAMDLHLQRLREASIHLFGSALPDENVLESIRLALDEGPEDMSLSTTIYLPQGEFTARSMGTSPAILIRTAPPSNGPTGPVRLVLVKHERHQAEIKHVGEGAKTYYLHQSIRQGFDDAAFVDRRGRLSEATIWNLAFWDGESVIWPCADILTGTMMGMVQRQLKSLGVPQQFCEVKVGDLKNLSGAAIMNSWTPGVAVTAMGQTVIPESMPFMMWLQRACEAEPWLPV